MATRFTITQAMIDGINTRAAAYRQVVADINVQKAQVASDKSLAAQLRSAAEKLALATEAKVAAGGTGGGSGGGTGTPTGSLLYDVINAGGDSITEGTPNNPNPWIKQLAALLGSAVTVGNYGHSSTTLNQMKDNWGANDYPGPHAVAGKRNLFISGPAGTNDFTQDNVTLDSLISYVKALFGRAKAAGSGYQAAWDSTLLPRALGGSPPFTSAHLAILNDFNTWKRANWASYCDKLLDFNSVVTVNDLADGTHPKDDPASKNMAAVAYAAITGGVTLADSSITTNGAIDNDKYRAIAAKMGRAEGVAYRYGGQAPAVANKPTWFQPGNHPWPEDIVGTHSGEWQLGTFRTYDGVFVGGDFASNIMWIPYVADDPVARIGLLELQATSTDHGTFTQKPEKSWTRYGGGEDAVEAVWWKNTQGKTLRNPICSANTLDRPGWGTQCVTFFSDGFFCTTGANTMTNKASGQLPAGLTPVACCVTGANGLCLVVCWDIPNLRGVLVAISLCGLGHDATLAKPDNGSWWNEWREAHPGLHNLGNLVFMKVLGQMVLPGMMAPTDISATTHHSRFGYLDGSPGDPSCYNQTFNDSGGESRRQAWLSGGSLERAYVKQAECIIVSRTERRALFVDLKPLYTFMNSMYFSTDRSKYDETRNIGQNAGQWPYTFAERPQQMPTVTKTVTFDDEPTCVFMAPYSEREEWRQAWIGFRNGKVRVFNTGGVNDTGNAAAKVEVASFDVGLNPTKITWTKEKSRATEKALVPFATRQLQVCVRGEAAIKWYDMTSPTTAVLRRTFQDSRLVDPINIIDTDNHGGEHYVTAIADYAGRKVHNVRWGDMIMWTYPEQTRLKCGANGTDPFEYCGSYPVQGYPFQVNSANVS